MQENHPLRRAGEPASALQAIRSWMACSNGSVYPRGRRKIRANSRGNWIEGRRNPANGSEPPWFFRL